VHINTGLVYDGRHSMERGIPSQPSLMINLIHHKLKVVQQNKA